METFEGKATFKLMKDGRIKLVLHVDSFDAEDLCLEPGDMPKEILDSVTVVFTNKREVEAMRS